MGNLPVLVAEFHIISLIYIDVLLSQFWQKFWNVLSIMVSGGRENYGMKKVWIPISPSDEWSKFICKVEIIAILYTLHITWR